MDIFLLKSIVTQTATTAHSKSLSLSLSLSLSPSLSLSRSRSFQLYITIMDKLRLEIKAKDELQPDMRDLLDTMNRLSVLPEEFEGTHGRL